MLLSDTKPVSNTSLDLRTVATYPVADAARHLSIPAGTLRSWLHGRKYPTNDGERYFEPLITSADSQSRQLSFINLVEAHVLRVIRQDHKVRLDKVRTALDYLEQQFGLTHPLARVQFKTDGIDLFVESVGRLISASQKGQTVMHEVLEHLLDRIEWDEDGLAMRLYPLLRPQDADAPRVLVIDPRISYGRPVVVNTGISAATVIDRFKAGEDSTALAKDYGFDQTQIDAIIRHELAA